MARCCPGKPGLKAGGAGNNCSIRKEGKGRLGGAEDCGVLRFLHLFIQYRAIAMRARINIVPDPPFAKVPPLNMLRTDSSSTMVTSSPLLFGCHGSRLGARPRWLLTIGCLL